MLRRRWSKKRRNPNVSIDVPMFNSNDFVVQNQVNNWRTRIKATIKLSRMMMVCLKTNGNITRAKEIYLWTRVPNLMRITKLLGSLKKRNMLLPILKLEQIRTKMKKKLFSTEMGPQLPPRWPLSQVFGLNLNHTMIKVLELERLMPPIRAN